MVISKIPQSYLRYAPKSEKIFYYGERLQPFCACLASDSVKAGEFHEIARGWLGESQVVVDERHRTAPRAFVSKADN